ncbi:darobactin export ABC transporter periplasmic adaptor subunit [Sodalis endosymbiont of Spalangia cameroni]|uniref:darobactin export ABC transporter periplasmic adaptor subunit n=1 Tax=Sodalis praecaptivus TaxID=1239307 RepID=UPI0031F9F5B9
MDIKIDKPGGIHRRARWITAGAVLLFLLILGLLYWLMSREGALTVPRREVTFHTVQRQPYTDMLVVRAIAIPNESVILSSERGGKVVEICKSSSDPVKKNDVIARLANYDFVLDVTSRIASATEQINNLRNMRMLLERNTRDTKVDLQKSYYNVLKITRNIERSRQLHEKSAIARATYEDLLDELQHWKTNYAIFEQHSKAQDKMLPVQIHEIDESIRQLGNLVGLIKGGLDQLVLTSPIDGILSSSLDIKPGQQIKPGEKVAVIDNLAAYHFEAEFSEYYLDKIRRGMKVMAHSGDADFPLVIDSVSPMVDNGKFKAKLVLLQPLQRFLKRGQSVEVRVALAAAGEALLVPSRAIFYQQGQARLFVSDAQRRRAVKTAVTIKPTGGAQTAVISGLQEGQQVVAFANNQYQKNNLIEFK